MEILVGAIVLLWMWSALSGEKLHEANMGWGVIFLIGLVIYAIS